MTSGTALWYLTRGSGVVALLLLTASTLLGVLTAGRWRNERWPRFAVAALHRNLTLVAMAFIGIHVGTTIADAYAPIGIKDIFVPFASQYRPVWVGFGALAVDLLLAVAISSALRRRIGFRTWRAIHWASYATWPLAVVHGLGTGSDARTNWLALFTVGCLVAVVVAVAGRLYASRAPVLQFAAGGATLALVVLLGSWYSTGPRKHGWAARAGTPTALLASARTAATPVSSRTLAAVHRVARFDGRLLGRMSSSGPDQYGDAAVALAMAVRGGEPGVVDMTIWGSALEGGGLQMTRSQVSFTDARNGSTYTGSVTGLQGNLVVADVTSSSGSALRLTMQLHLDSTTGSATGTVRGAPLTSGEVGAE